MIYLAECQQGDILAGFSDPYAREDWAPTHTAATDPGHVFCMWAAEFWETWSQHCAAKRRPRETTEPG